MGTLFMLLAAALVLLVIVGVKKVSQGSVYVVENLGKFSKIAEPGIFFCMPFYSRVRNKVLICEQSLDIPPQTVIT